MCIRTMCVAIVVVVVVVIGVVTVKGVERGVGGGVFRRSGVVGLICTRENII